MAARGSADGVEDPGHVIPVGRQSLLTRSREPVDGARDLADKRLLYVDVAGRLEFGRVRRQIPLGEARLIQEEQEVGLLDRVEDRQHRQPARLVDQPIGFNGRW